MIYYPAFPLIGGLAALGLSIIVFRSNQKGEVNRLFALFSFFVSIWSFFMFLGWSAASIEAAAIYEKVETVFATCAISFLFHFFLVFTKVNEKRIKYYALPVYILGATSALLALTTNLVTERVEASYWGYRVVPGIFGDAVFVPYIICAFSIGLVLSVRRLRKEKDKQEKKGLWMAVIGLSVFLIGSVITDLFTQFIGDYVMPSGSFLAVFMSVFIVYGMRRYQLMSLTPAIASENIIETMADYLLVLNKDGTVAFTSDSLLKGLGYRDRGQLEGNMAKVFADRPLKETMSMLEKKGTVTDDDFKVRTKDGNDTPISLNGSRIKGNAGETLGYVLIMRDMTRVQELIADLEDRTQELERSKKELEVSKEQLEVKMAEAERLNKLAVGRELKMIELKKRLREAESKGVGNERI